MIVIGNAGDAQAVASIERDLAVLGRIRKRSKEEMNTASYHSTALVDTPGWTPEHRVVMGGDTQNIEERVTNWATIAFMVYRLWKWFRMAAPVIAAAADRDELSIAQMERVASSSLKDGEFGLHHWFMDRSINPVLFALVSSTTPRYGFRPLSNPLFMTRRGGVVRPNTSASPLDAKSYLYDLLQKAAPYMERDSFAVRRDSTQSVCDCKHGSFWDAPNRKEGTIFKSKFINAQFQRLPEGVFAETQLGSMPFTVNVSPDCSLGRAEIAFVHEIVHVMDQLYKLGLTHERVHDLSLFMTGEVIPAVLAFRARANKNQ